MPLSIELRASIPYDHQAKAGTVEYHLTQGADALEQRRWEEAAKSYSQAIKLDPDSAAAYLGRGMANWYWAQNKNVFYTPASAYDAAIADFKKAIELGGSSRAALDARYDLGLVYSKRGDYLEAARQLMEVAQLAPKNVFYQEARDALGPKLVGAGQKKTEEGKLEEAIEAYTRALVLRPQMSEAYAGRAQAEEQLARQEWQEAERHDRTAERQTSLGNPQAAAKEREAAEALHGQAREHADQALADLRKAQGLEPKRRVEAGSAEAYYDRARGCEGLGASDEAIEAYNQALQLQPDNLTYRLARAQLRLERREFDDAAADLELVIQKRREPALLELHATALEGAGRLEEAGAQLLAAWTIQNIQDSASESIPQLRRRLSHLSFDLGAEAEQALDEMRTEDAERLLKLAGKMESRTDSQNAINEYLRARMQVQKAEQAELREDWSGAISYYKDAIEHFERQEEWATQTNPALLAAAHHALGLAYARVGELEKADAQIAQAIEMDPTQEAYAKSWTGLAADYVRRADERRGTNAAGSVLDDCQAAIAHDPQDRAGYNRIGAYFFGLAQSIPWHQQTEASDEALRIWARERMRQRPPAGADRAERIAFAKKLVEEIEKRPSRLDRAVAAAYLAQEADPQDPVLEYNLGRAHAIAKRFDLAAADLLRAIERSEAQGKLMLEAHDQLADIYYELGDLGAAAQQLRICQRIEPADHHSYISSYRYRLERIEHDFDRMGQRYLQDRQYDVAADFFQQAADIDPQEARYAKEAQRCRDQLFAQAVAQLDAGDRAGAKKAFVEIHRLEERNPRAKPYLARIAQADGDDAFAAGAWSAAIERYGEALSWGAEGTRLRERRAGAYARTGQEEAAIKELDRAIELDPKNWEAYRQRGMLLCTKQDAQAVRDLDRALEGLADPAQIALVHQEAGLASQRLGRPLHAILHFGAALGGPAEMDEMRRADLHLYQARSEMEMMQSADALRDLDAAISAYQTRDGSAPLQAEAHRRRAELRLAGGDATGALVDLDRVIWLAPKDASTYALRAQARCEMGQFGPALDDTEQALELDERNAQAYLARAQIGYETIYAPLQMLRAEEADRLTEVLRSYEIRAETSKENADALARFNKGGQDAMVYDADKRPYLLIREAEGIRLFALIPDEARRSAYERIKPKDGQTIAQTIARDYEQTLRLSSLDAQASEGLRQMERYAPIQGMDPEQMAADKAVIGVETIPPTPPLDAIFIMRAYWPLIRQVDERVEETSGGVQFHGQSLRTREFKSGKEPSPAQWKRIAERARAGEFYSVDATPKTVALQVGQAFWGQYLTRNLIPWYIPLSINLYETQGRVAVYKGAGYGPYQIISRPTQNSRGMTQLNERIQELGGAPLRVIPETGKDYGYLSYKGYAAMAYNMYWRMEVHSSAKVGPQTLGPDTKGYALLRRVARDYNGAAGKETYGEKVALTSQYLYEQYAKQAPPMRTVPTQPLLAQRGIESQKVEVSPDPIQAVGPSGAEKRTPRQEEQTAPGVTRTHNVGRVEREDKPTSGTAGGKEENTAPAKIGGKKRAATAKTAAQIRQEALVAQMPQSAHAGLNEAIVTSEYNAVVVRDARNLFIYAFDQPVAEAKLDQVVRDLNSAYADREVVGVFNGGYYDVARKEVEDGVLDGRKAAVGLMVNDGKVILPSTQDTAKGQDTIRPRYYAPAQMRANVKKARKYMEFYQVLWIDQDGHGHIEPTPTYMARHENASDPLKHPDVLRAWENGPAIFTDGKMEVHKDKTSQARTARTLAIQTRDPHTGEETIMLLTTRKGATYAQAGEMAKLAAARAAEPVLVGATAEPGELMHQLQEQGIRIDLEKTKTIERLGKLSSGKIHQLWLSAADGRDYLFTRDGAGRIEVRPSTILNAFFHDGGGSSQSYVGADPSATIRGDGRTMSYYIVVTQARGK